MALAITKSRQTVSLGDLADLIVQFNTLLDTLRAEAVIMDADNGITDTGFTALLDAGPKKIGDPAGTARS
jgi:hypothetical protein